MRALRHDGCPDTSRSGKKRELEKEHGNETLSPLPPHLPAAGRRGGRGESVSLPCSFSSSRFLPLREVSGQPSCLNARMKEARKKSIQSKGGTAGLLTGTRPTSSGVGRNLTRISAIGVCYR